VYVHVPSSSTDTVATSTPFAYTLTEPPLSPPEPENVGCVSYVAAPCESSTASGAASSSTLSSVGALSGAVVSTFSSNGSVCGPSLPAASSTANVRL
jgi:hypothetical protein